MLSQPGTSWRSTVGLTPQQLSSREEGPGYPLNTMLGGPNGGTEVLMKKKILLALSEI